MKCYEIMYEVDFDQRDMRSNPVFYAYDQAWWRHAWAVVYEIHARHDKWLKWFDRQVMKRKSLPKDCCLDHDHAGEPGECWILPPTVARDLKVWDYNRNGQSNYRRVEDSDVPRSIRRKVRRHDRHIEG